VTDTPTWVPVLILFGLLLLAYLAMWRGWRRRGRKHDLPPLVEVSADRAGSVLRADGRYFGTTTSGRWLDRVVARGLGTRSTCRLTLSGAGLDVERPAASFRVPAAAMRAARRDRGIAGKVMPPDGVLVVTWQHGDHLLDTGFRLDPALTPRGESSEAGSVREMHEAWVDAIERMTKENAA
jgi:hypothetical protein